MTILINFFEALAVFSSHDILPLNIVGDVTLYEQLKSKWDAMDGDEKCQCDWCDAEPLQYQEELQFAEKQESKDVSISISQYRQEVMIAIKGLNSVVLSAREAYALLSELYDKRDEIYKASQQDESEPVQEAFTHIRDRGREPDEYWAGDTIGKTCDAEGCNNPAKITKHHSKTDEKVRLCHEHRDLDPDTVKQQPDTEHRQYAEKHLSEHIKEAGIILYTVITDRYALPVRYLLPDAVTPEWFSPHKFNDPGEASQESLTKYPDAEYVSAEELEEEYRRREKEHWEKHPLQVA